ncbi:putative late blight resistance protein homolog R1B-16 isoform X2 [Rhododendron vialii]|uniref:putative late blight resistance protein homolog R1B-16 isoform X2 n=1 Tax=Rhododendron vialii TaxID=182163 RepID=UPI00265E6281|nr:putative late blight resistance protein homolog R1B-16 isoform X2 [Rhododendron vialii]XP_058210470.1 putative late blight resistance protein homolog R1B-16 isoform X2 [Rhododendron vialii]
MGDITVDFFQETLKQLITSSKLGLTIDEKCQLQSLQEEIENLGGFLKVTEKKRNEHSKLMELVMQIRDVVFEAENIIYLFVGRDFKRPNAYQYLDHPSLGLESVKKKIKTLMVKVKQIYDMKMYDINGVAVKIPKYSSTGSEGSAGSSGGSNTSKLVKENVVVGFKEEVNRVIEKLDDRREGRPLEIITIIGAGGGGKTTLAREVYDHPFTLYTFEIRAWVDVSQDYNKTMKKNLLIRILKLASPGKHVDYEGRSKDELGEDVHKCLKGRKYLIVMDDIWGIEAWNDMQRSFPKECKGSKVLFTSRLVVQPDNISYVPHFLDPLSKYWSWELLQNKVFGMKCCPPELVDIGEQIAQKCDGLPLAIVTIAGILKKKDKTLKVWVEAAEHLSSIIAKNQEGCMEILELSYNHLPLHLKACFLYIGGFDEDREIPVRDLIWLWIAEGFIQQSEGKSLEAMAKDYLLDLIDRNLIIVARKNPLGRIKACRIHDLLRELCLKKAEEDNFLVKIYEDDFFQTFASNNHCRLFTAGRKFNAGKHFVKFTEKSHHAQKVRTLCCPRMPDSWESWHKLRHFLENYLENFKNLRVLSYKSYESLGSLHLVHLRYLQMVHTRPGPYWFEAPFSHHLETINFELRMDVTTIKLPYDIFMMVKLRHLYSKRSKFAYHCCLHLPSSEEEETARTDFDQSSKLDSLQTLDSICACEVCLRFLVGTPNLRKLGIRGDLISKDGVSMIPDLEFLKFLETLSLMRCQITLQKVLKLPPTITQLSLRYTCFKWEELSILQTALPSLEVLKLRHCRGGSVWKTSEEGFSQLKYLKLDGLDIKEWNASEDQFPRLEVLVLHRCKLLAQIPMDFANLNELREIEIAECTSSMEKSAREIQEEQRNNKGDDCCLNLRLHANTFSDSILSTGNAFGAFRVPIISSTSSGLLSRIVFFRVTIFLLVISPPPWTVVGALLCVGMPVTFFATVVELCLFGRQFSFPCLTLTTTSLTGSPPMQGFRVPTVRAPLGKSFSFLLFGIFGSIEIIASSNLTPTRIGWTLLL